MSIKLKRFQKNPILVPKRQNAWESKAVFNCGTAQKEGFVHMLYRAIGEYKFYISRLGYARSKDGLDFQRMSKKPVLEPSQDYDRWGCEDPRITVLDGKIYVTYVALHKPALSDGGGIKGFPGTAITETSDFFHFKKLGAVTPERLNDRDTVLFPEKINGHYVFLHRPRSWFDGQYGTHRPSIWIAYSSDFKNLYGSKLVMKPQARWESRQLGSGPPPVKTRKGWLLIYHGVDEKHVYRAGAALLDLEDPSKVLSRSRIPILEPQENYEKSGDAPNVVFPEGTAIIGKNLFVYYGAADKTVCVATINLEDLLSALTSSK